MKTRSITAPEIKSLTSKKSLHEAVYALYQRLQSRSWTRNGMAYAIGGINWEKDRVSFCSFGDGGHYRYLYTTIADACDAATGNLSPENSAYGPGSF